MSKELGNHEGIAIVFFLGFMISITIMNGFMQWNGNIEEQKRFRINDKVYQCALIKSFTVDDDQKPTEAK